MKTRNRKHLWRAAFLLLAAILLEACTTIQTSPPVALDRSATWVLLPFVNATDTPLAAQRAESVALGLARSLGLGDIQAYPQKVQDESLFETGQGHAQELAMDWAHAQQARYALSGTVQEWRYKVGVDGEPAVGVSLQVIDLASNRVVWSAVGARTGWSRESLAAVAQKLMHRMLADGLND